jgi:hypothetical protein
MQNDGKKRVEKARYKICGGGARYCRYLRRYFDYSTIADKSKLIEIWIGIDR